VPEPLGQRTYACHFSTEEFFVNNPLLYIALIVWAISSVGLIIFVLLHSGKGSGLSEMLGGAMSPASAGTSIIEKNLDRITVGFAVAFGVSLIVLMIVYPHGI
jgi:preprotein translocase subunit SecG